MVLGESGLWFKAVEYWQESPRIQRSTVRCQLRVVRQVHHQRRGEGNHALNEPCSKQERTFCWYGCGPHERDRRVYVRGGVEQILQGDPQKVDESAGALTVGSDALVSDCFTKGRVGGAVTHGLFAEIA